MIETVPTLRAVTTPALLTTAIVVSLLVHVGVMPVRTSPFMSDSEAVTVTVSPTSREMFVGETNTEATLEMAVRSW